MAVIAWRQAVFVFGRGAKHTCAHTHPDKAYYISSSPRGPKTAKICWDGDGLESGVGLELETARLSLWQSARSHSLAWGFIDCRIGSDSGERGLIATFCVVTSTLSNWTWLTADSWSILHCFSWGCLGDLPIRRLASLRSRPWEDDHRIRADLVQMFPHAESRWQPLPPRRIRLYLPVWARGWAVINTPAWLGRPGTWVWAPSFSRCRPLQSICHQAARSALWRRSSGVSWGLARLGTGITHKHHLSGIRPYLLGAFNWEATSPSPISDLVHS